MQEVSYNLRKLRKAKGLTQQQLADELDVTTTFIANIEQGVRRPSLLVLEKMAEILGSKLKDFFEDVPGDE